MEQGKSKYEVAMEILEKFNTPYIALKKFASSKPGRTINGNPNTKYEFETTEQVENALEWYLKQYQKVLNTFGDF